jgi:nucleoside-diphosphate-sugar epimerase
MSHCDLVTGATGCLGSNLVERLVSEGRKVRVLVPHGEPLGRLHALRRELDVKHGDVRSADDVAQAMAGVTRVYNVAGIAVPSNRLERKMWEVNVYGVHNVVGRAAKVGVERVVHVSSTAAIGYPPDGVVASERFRFEDSITDNAYSRTKYYGEQVALGFNGAGTDVVVVNPAAVIAPGGDKRFGWSGVIDVAMRGLLRVMPRGGSSFCSAADLVDGVLGAMRVGKPGERYILSSQNLTYRELGNLVAAAVGVTAPQLTVPSWLLRALAALNERLLPRERISVLVPENVALMTRTLYYDQSKAVRELGISQTPVATALGLVNEWIRSEVSHAGI